MIVLGLDPSSTSTGYAWAPNRYGVLVPGSVTGLPRIRWQREAVGSLVAHLRAHERLRMVVYEGPAYDTRSQQGQHERAGLWWHLLDELDTIGVPVAVAPPSNLKVFALGKGSGSDTDKLAVTLAASRRLGYAGNNDNEADALWLAAMGYARLGVPLVSMPASHTRGLDGVRWPAGV